MKLWTDLGHGWSVSTIDVPFQWMIAPFPIVEVFESIVFDNNADEMETIRYDNAEYAEAGHLMLVEKYTVLVEKYTGLFKYPFECQARIPERGRYILVEPKPEPESKPNVRHISHVKEDT